MEFPITREALQNFNRAAAQEKKEKEQRYDFYRRLIQDICKDVENNMMGKLNNYLHTPQTFGYTMPSKKVMKTAAPLYNTTSAAEAVIHSTVSDTQYVWKYIEILAYWKSCINPHSDIQSYIQRFGGPIECYRTDKLRNMCQKSTEDFNQSLPEFIEMLKETFIGCDIIVDPLKTYLIIDWS